MHRLSVGYYIVHCVGCYPTKGHDVNLTLRVYFAPTNFTLSAYLASKHIGDSACFGEVESIKTLQLKRKKLKKFDEIWVVFDKDDNKDFEDAIRLALSLKYKVAYTNQAFEYWFVLHFIDHQGNAMPRTDYAEQINKHLKQHGAEYDPKSKHISDEMFDVLWAFLQDAYDRATRILESKKKQRTEYAESVTTVQTLIHSINGMTTRKEKLKTEHKKLSGKFKIVRD